MNLSDEEYITALCVNTSYRLEAPLLAAGMEGVQYV